MFLGIGVIPAMASAAINASQYTNNDGYCFHKEYKPLKATTKQEKCKGVIYDISIRKNYNR